MKNRIKEVRKSRRLTQEEFGKLIGVKGNTITNYENGLRNPSDAIINSICREFNVNEDWLRTGEGEMYTDRDDVADVVSEIMENTNPLYDMVVDIIKAYSELDEPSKKAINNLIDKIKSGEVKAS